MEQLIQRISAALGIDEATAKAAVGQVFRFLKSDLPEDLSTELFGHLPWAQELIDAAEAHPAEGLGAAVMGGLGGLIGGARGDIMALAGKLMSLGLDMGQMQQLGHEVFAHAEEIIGKENVDKIIEAIPSLAPFR
ncbi:MAG TPA: DUF2267 domain-containing protein [Methylocystis sp.]|nr:DUF2267 domain-containing protein [Methylocystis sp.]